MWTLPDHHSSAQSTEILVSNQSDELQALTEVSIVPTGQMRTWTKALLQWKNLSASRMSSNTQEMVDTSSDPQYDSSWCWLLLQDGPSNKTFGTSYLGDRDQKDYGLRPDQSKSLWDSHLNQWLDMVECACHPSYVGKHILEDRDPGQLRHKDPISKITNTKMGFVE
jgi:hypothetical protein